MFGINAVMDYIRFLRNKETLERLIKNHILIKKPKCHVCGFEYSTIDHIHEKLPFVSFIGKDYKFICNNCRDKY